MVASVAYFEWAAQQTGQTPEEILSAGQAILADQRARRLPRPAALPVRRLTGIEGVAREPQHFAVRPATEKAVKYLVDLWMERSDKATREQVQAWAEQQDWTVVRDKIDWLKDQPKLATARIPIPDVPAGRYAVTGEQGQTVFLKVDRPAEGTYAGRTFVKVQASDEYHPMALPVAKALLAKILADGLKAASIRYGKELGFCGVCGRILTDETSRAEGIGPKCAQRF